MSTLAFVAINTTILASYDSQLLAMRSPKKHTFMCIQKSTMSLNVNFSLCSNQYYHSGILWLPVVNAMRSPKKHTFMCIQKSTMSLNVNFSLCCNQHYHSGIWCYWMSTLAFDFAFVTINTTILEFYDSQLLMRCAHRKSIHLCVYKSLNVNFIHKHLHQHYHSGILCCFRIFCATFISCLWLHWLLE